MDHGKLRRGPLACLQTYFALFLLLLRSFEDFGMTVRADETTGISLGARQLAVRDRGTYIISDSFQFLRSVGLYPFSKTYIECEIFLVHFSTTCDRDFQYTARPSLKRQLSFILSHQYHHPQPMQHPAQATKPQMAVPLKVLLQRGIRLFFSPALKIYVRTCPSMKSAPPRTKDEISDTASCASFYTSGAS